MRRKGSPRSGPTDRGGGESKGVDGHPFGALRRPEPLRARAAKAHPRARSNAAPLSAVRRESTKLAATQKRNHAATTLPHTTSSTAAAATQASVAAESVHTSGHRVLSQNTVNK